MTARLTWSVILCLCQLLSQVRVTQALRIHVHEDASIGGELKCFNIFFRRHFIEIRHHSGVRRAISDMVDYWSSTLKVRSSSVNSIHVGKDAPLDLTLLTDPDLQRGGVRARASGLARAAPLTEAVQRRHAVAR